MRALVHEYDHKVRVLDLDDDQVKGEYRGAFSKIACMELCHEVKTLPYIFYNDNLPETELVVYYNSNPDIDGKYNKNMSEFLPLDAGCVFGSAIITKAGKDEYGYCLDGLSDEEIDILIREINKNVI